MSEDPRGLEHLRFEYLIPEFARPDFKLPGEAPVKKGNEPMDEELFTEETINRLTEPEGAAPRNAEYYEALVVDIFTYTEHALKLQLAVVVAESYLEHAKQKRREAATALDDARAKLENHLNTVRGTHVTLRGGLHE